MKSALHCQYTGNGVIAHIENEKGITERISMADVRAGVVFPTGALPGYYLMIARKWDQLPSGKRILYFMTEGESLVHEELFTKLTDDCIKFKCKTLYAELPRQDRKGGIGGFDDLYRFIRNKRMGINLIQAPAARDVEYGKALLREYWSEEAIKLPYSDINYTTIVSHLKPIRGFQEAGDGTDDSNYNEDNLYAFHAMRHVLAGFVKYNNVIQYEKKFKKDPKANPKGWT